MRVDASLAVDHAEAVGRALLARIAADEAAADETRAAIERDGLPSVQEADAEGLLDAGERVVAVRPGVTVAVVDATPDVGTTRGDRVGRLYVTDRRLVVSGSDPLSVLLGAIEELSVAGERLLVALRDGSGVSVDVPRPRELRVLIAAALASARA